jgi:2-polyprenyl-3-methyl-5-hydroxy-6-metoxy-1,4-benzoquinol methylase
MSTEKRDFDKAAATWDEVPRRVKLAGDIARAITENVALNAQMDILDFGCGTGLLGLRLQPLVRSVTGVDSSQGMLDALKAKVQELNLENVKTQHLDMDGGGTLEGTFHLVVSGMTLHHVKDIDSLLVQFHKVTAPSGYVCVADLDPDGGQFHENNDGVFHLGFERAKLRKAFVDAGFEDVRDLTAAEVEKPNPNGGMRSFSVFLLVGRKRSR